MMTAWISLQEHWRARGRVLETVKMWHYSLIFPFLKEVLLDIKRDKVTYDVTDMLKEEIAVEMQGTGIGMEYIFVLGTC